MADSEHKLPFELTLIITHSCNLNCRYCYEHNKSSMCVMSFDVAKQAIEHYMSEGDYQEVKIGFIGGEPLLEFKLIKKICEWFWSEKWNKKYIFYATTNGTVLNCEMKEWFSKNKEHFWLSLSLDGTRDTHNWNRCNSFDKIDFDFFRSNWPEQPVKMTIGEDRLEHLAEDIIFIHSLGFKLNGCNFAEGIQMSDFEPKLQIIAQQFEKLIDFYIEHPEFEARIFNLPLASCEIKDNTYKKRCGTGENMAVIDYDGQKYPCTFFSPVSLNKEQLLEISNIDFLKIENFIDPECISSCYLYPICFGCYGDNFATTGSMKTRSFQKCQIAKLKALATANFLAKELSRKLNNAEKISEKDKMTINAIIKINEQFSNN